MPTPRLMQISKSVSEQEFESLCLDVISDYYKVRFVKYGRNGQKQKGIDLRADTKSGHIVGQCKNYYKENSSYKLVANIEKDIADTKGYQFKIIKFIAMTSMDRDTKVQDDILNINCDFKIDMWFWEDIQEQVCDNNKLLKRYYPQLFSECTIPVAELNDAINNLNIIQRIAYDINRNYANYQPACNYNSDTQVYNYCVSMYNAGCKLVEFKYSWYLQLERFDSMINNSLENIQQIIPVFYDESKDGLGFSMVSTISNYISYFSDINNVREMQYICRQVVEQLKKVGGIQ